VKESQIPPTRCAAKWVLLRPDILGGRHKFWALTLTGKPGSALPEFAARFFEPWPASKTPRKWIPEWARGIKLGDAQEGNGTG